MLNQLSHKPVIVCLCGKVSVSLALDVDLVGWRFDLSNVLSCCVMGACVILRAHEEGHGHSVDFGNIDEICGLLAIEPVWSELLEAIYYTIHAPVLLGFH